MQSGGAVLTVYSLLSPTRAWDLVEPASHAVGAHKAPQVVKCIGRLPAFWDQPRVALALCIQVLVLGKSGARSWLLAFRTFHLGCITISLSELIYLQFLHCAGFHPRSFWVWPCP